MNLDRRAKLAGAAAIAAVAARTTGTVVSKEAAPPFFPGFRTLNIDASDVRFAGVVGRRSSHQH